MTTERSTPQGAASPGAATRGVQRDAEHGEGTDPAAQVAAARAELATTLDAIQDRLDVPKRVRTAARDNPIGLAAVGVGVAASIAGAAWLLVRALRSR